MQQAAWLNSRPGDEAKQSRLEAYEEKGITPPYPETEGAEYLLNYLFEIGPTVPAGMGSGPISFQDIRAWQELTGIDLKPWEARAIRTLSIVYLNQVAISDKADCPAPTGAEVDKMERATHIKSLLRG